MSDNIPFEIQVEIIERISDVKSLIKFRSVSKPLKSVIDSPKFIADFHTRHHNHRLLVHSRENYYSIVDDDDSFPQQDKIPAPMTVPMYDKLLPPELFVRNISATISQGLVCLYNTCENPRDDPGTKSVLLWNLAIRKSVHIVVPNVLFIKYRYKTVIGFGVSPHTNDPMLLKIICIFPWYNSDTTSCIPGQVEVFKLSTGVWRSLCTNLPRRSIGFSDYNVVIDRFIYWVSVDWFDLDASHSARRMIMSFDMTREEFTEISLPVYLARLSYRFSVKISMLRESLVLLGSDMEEHVVWIMEHGVPNSFRKLFTIKAQNSSISDVYGFRKSGELIVQRFFSFGKQYVPSVYEPCSQHFNDIEISKNAYLDSMSPYTETLLLLDR